MEEVGGGVGKGYFSWHPYHYISHGCLVLKKRIQRKHQLWCPAGLESVSHAVSPEKFGEGGHGVCAACCLVRAEAGGAALRGPHWRAPYIPVLLGLLKDPRFSQIKHLLLNPE